MKRQLHALYIKHDGAFKTLSKIALAQIILKIVHIKGTGVLIKQITAELNNILLGTIPHKDIEDALKHLIHEEKIHAKEGRYFVHSKYQNELAKAEAENRKLHQAVLDKYFKKVESEPTDIEVWFQETTIKFFEKFSFEWFHQMAYKGRNSSNHVPNLNEIIDEVILASDKINATDKEWLKTQYFKFIDSEDATDNLVFWQYGISMFSSRLITARNYADGISIELFKNGKFVLDTNILMILDLEEHELSESLKSLEKILETLKITPVYFASTRDEYTRAMSWRKKETVNIFNNYTFEVLKASDCPFIRTALKRGCRQEEDIINMFDVLLNMPEKFQESLKIVNYDFKELEDAIEFGRNDEKLKKTLNEIYKRRTSRDKRENPLLHDAGLIRGAEYIRKEENKCWLLTNDSNLKFYAIENCLRDDSEIAIGLDVLIGLLAVNSGGVGVDASSFAPLFKNIVKYALIPETDAFEIRDLAFILSTHTKINELPDERVIEVAKEVKRMRVSGASEETVSLFLRRVIEGDKLTLVKDIREVIEREQLAKSQREQADKEKEVFVQSYRSRRKGELQDKYDSELRKNRLMILLIPSIIGLILYFTIKKLLPNQSHLNQLLIGFVPEVVCGILPMFPLNKKFVKKHSEYVTKIDDTIDREIIELKNQAV